MRWRPGRRLPTVPGVTALRDRLATELTARLRSRDREAVAALRTARAALDNAEAVPVVATARADEGPIAGAVLGLGAAETERRTLSEAEERTVVAAEVDELLLAAATYDDLGDAARAASARGAAEVLRGVLSATG